MKNPNLKLPKHIRTLEDMVRFFMYLDRVDRMVFHPDDRFYSHGQVQYSDRDGNPAYTVQQAKLRDRLMGEAWTVARREGVDIYEVGLFTLNSPGYEDLNNAVDKLRDAILNVRMVSSRKHWKV